MHQYLNIMTQFLILAISLAASCKRVETSKRSLDEFSFGLTGGTVFTEPFKVNTKQLHFDTGDLFGRDVVIEGDIVELGESSTYLTLSDQEGRVLVVLTDLDDAYLTLHKNNIKHVKVLGRLERGKKGLPYLMAKALRPASKIIQ